MRITVVSEQMVGKRWTKAAHEQLLAEYTELCRDQMCVPAHRHSRAIWALILDILELGSIEVYGTLNKVVCIATNPKLFSWNRVLHEDLVLCSDEPIGKGCFSDNFHHMVSAKAVTYSNNLAVSGPRAAEMREHLRIQFVPDDILKLLEFTREKIECENKLRAELGLK